MSISKPTAPLVYDFHFFHTFSRRFLWQYESIMVQPHTMQPLHYFCNIAGVWWPDTTQPCNKIPQNKIPQSLNRKTSATFTPQPVYILYRTYHQVRTSSPRPGVAGGITKTMQPNVAKIGTLSVRVIRVAKSTQRCVVCDLSLIHI